MLTDVDSAGLLNLLDHRYKAAPAPSPAASRLSAVVFTALADLLSHAAVDTSHAAVTTRAMRALAATLAQAGAGTLATADQPPLTAMP